MRVFAEKCEEIAPADVEHRTRRNNRAETHMLGEAPVENRRQQRSALAQKGDTSGTRHILRERGIQSNQRIHQTETIRTDQTSPAALQLHLDLFFERSALWPFFSEPCRNHDDRFRVGAHTFGNDTRYSV